MIENLVVWLNALPSSFAFLLALPFVVGLVGLLKEVVDDRNRRG